MRHLTRPQPRARVSVMVACVLAWLSAALWSASALAESGPHIEPARGGQCVADPATMRRFHMEKITHQRDETVRKGVRDGKDSLQACVACHTNDKVTSVTEQPNGFCVSCHSYAAVKIDCFQCHASKPTAAAIEVVMSTTGGKK